MNVSVRWLSGQSFTGVDDRGHTVRIDGPPKLGGKDEAPRPMELLLMALASCSMVDIVMILEKMKNAPESLEIEVRGDRGEETPAVFRAIHLTVRASGVSERRLRRAVGLSIDKYCSVAAMLRHDAAITWEVMVS